MIMLVVFNVDWDILDAICDAVYNLPTLLGFIMKLPEISLLQLHETMNEADVRCKIIVKFPFILPILLNIDFVPS